MDVIKGSMVTNALCLIPGILLLLKPHETKEEKLDSSAVNEAKKRMATRSRNMIRIATVCQVIALILWPILAFFDNHRNNIFWCLPVALILISLSWWENFINRSSNNIVVQKLLAVKKDLSESRYFTFAFVSIIKISVILGFMLLIIYLRDGTDAVNKMFSDFVDGFTSDQLEVNRQKISDDELIEGDTDWMTVRTPLIPMWILLLQICVSYVCYAFAKFTCKIHIQTFSFALPVHLAVPITCSFIWVMLELSVQDKCRLVDFFSGFQYIFWYTTEESAFDYYKNWENYLLAIVWFVSLASQIAIAIHIWSANSPRLASTEELFINPMYSSVMIDQSLALNRRRINVRDELLVEDDESPKDSDSGENFYESVNDQMSISRTREDTRRRHDHQDIRVRDHVAREQGRDDPDAQGCHAIGRRSVLKKECSGLLSVVAQFHRLLRN